MNVWNSLLVIRMLSAPTQLGPSLVLATMDTGETDWLAQVSTLHVCWVYLHDGFAFLVYWLCSKPILVGMFWVSKVSSVHISYPFRYWWMSGTVTLWWECCVYQYTWVLHLCLQWGIQWRWTDLHRSVLVHCVAYFTCVYPVLTSSIYALSRKPFPWG